MKSLQHPDSYHLQAAQGWLELGNHLEANEELEQITASLRAHPDVLELRWQIYAQAGKWDACVDIATAITKLAPERPVGWIHRVVCAPRVEAHTGSVGQSPAHLGQVPP